MLKRTYKLCLILVVLISTAGCDQITKRVAKAELISAPPVSLLGNVVRLEYSENPGAFLNLGENLPRPVLPIIVSILFAMVTFALLRLIVRSQEVRPALMIGLSLLAGGSAGNLIDRVVNKGVVIDFVSFGIGPVRTGIFNLADLAVMAGALLIVFVTFTQGRSEETAQVNDI